MIFNIKLNKLYDNFKKHPESKWIIGEDDVKRLYSIVRKQKVKNILELGTGIGAATAVMALASPDSKIFTVEQSQKCLDIAKLLIPEELKKNINFFYSELETFSVPQIKYQYFTGYKNVPLDVKYDFVLIDGPGAWLEGSYFVDLPGGDFIRVMTCLNEGTIVYIDGRKSIVKFINRFFGNFLKIIHSDAEHTLFVRTGMLYSPDKIIDKTIANRKIAGYL